MSAVFGKTKEYLNSSVSALAVSGSRKDLPSHVELNVMFGIIGTH